MDTRFETPWILPSGLKLAAGLCMQHQCFRPVHVCTSTGVIYADTLACCRPVGRLQTCYRPATISVHTCQTCGYPTCCRHVAVMYQSWNVPIPYLAHVTGNIQVRCMTGTDCITHVTDLGYLCNIHVT